MFSIGIISSQQIVNAADTIKLGLNFTNSGMLKTQGEGTEIAVDIAVAEINASGGINGKHWLPPLCDYKPPFEHRWPEYFYTKNKKKWNI